MSNKEIMILRDVVRTLAYCAGSIASHWQAAEQELRSYDAELTEQLGPTCLTDERQEALSWVLATSNLHN
jgi:hypothetical protein